MQSVWVEGSGCHIDSWEARLFGPSWVNLDIPRHLYHFSVRTLSQLLESVGFRMTDTLLPQSMPASISASVVHILKKHHIVLPRSLGRLIHAGILPLASCSYWLGNSGNVEVWVAKGT